MYKFYSQQLEDAFIFNNFINNVNEDGIFVELGGMDGITYSNTKFFEDDLKFRGVLIEPTNQYFSMKKNRPNCDCYNLAVNKEKSKVNFIGVDACGGLEETMDPDFRKALHSNSKVYHVEGEPFADILEKSQIQYIDLLSIDVEGGEQVVLQTMNWEIPVYVIVIELTSLEKEKDVKCREILKEKGFELVKRLNINEFWINKNYFRKNKLFNKDIPKATKNNTKFYYLEPYLRAELFKELENDYTSLNN